MWGCFSILGGESPTRRFAEEWGPLNIVQSITPVGPCPEGFPVFKSFEIVCARFQTIAELTNKKPRKRAHERKNGTHGHHR